MSSPPPPSEEEKFCECKRIENISYVTGRCYQCGSKSKKVDLQTVDPKPSSQAKDTKSQSSGHSEEQCIPKEKCYCGRVLKLFGWDKLKCTVGHVSELPKIPEDNGDWVCEDHPDQPAHECKVKGCRGAGMPPPAPGEATMEKVREFVERKKLIDILVDQEILDSFYEIAHSYEEMYKENEVLREQNLLMAREELRMHKYCCVLLEALGDGLKQIDNPHEHSLEYIENINKEARSQVSQYHKAE